MPKFLLLPSPPAAPLASAGTNTRADPVPERLPRYRYTPGVPAASNASNAPRAAHAPILTPATTPMETT